MLTVTQQTCFLNCFNLCQHQRIISQKTARVKFYANVLPELNKQYKQQYFFLRIYSKICFHFKKMFSLKYNFFRVFPPLGTVSHLRSPCGGHVVYFVLVINKVHVVCYIFPQLSYTDTPQCSVVNIHTAQQLARVPISSQVATR